MAMANLPMYAFPGFLLPVLRTILRKLPPAFPHWLDNDLYLQRNDQSSEEIGRVVDSNQRLRPEIFKCIIIKQSKTSA